jgi:hypothetical protein
MTQFRYRTQALLGPWRDSAEAAAEDAVRARQAVRNGPDRSVLQWLVQGHIENSAEAVVASDGALSPAAEVEE